MNKSVISDDQQLNDYDIKKVLGKGAYGVVFLVSSKTNDKLYALKQIEFQSSQHGLSQSVLREIGLMKKLSRENHPNILRLCNVSHCVVNNGATIKINLLLEKCDWDLYTFLKTVPRNLPDKQCRHFAAQLLRGLDFLHSQNVVHRDLKPQNILINRDQSLRIADFGLSRSFSNTSAFTTVVVTLWYRSPEVLLQTSYGSATDMWSVGCIISEIYNRQPLFPADSEIELFKLIFRIIGTPLRSEWPADSVVDWNGMTKYAKRDIKTINECLTPNAAEFVNACLEFNPAKRMTAANGLKHPYLSDLPTNVLQSRQNN